jgi:hypothetical protein
MKLSDGGRAKRPGKGKAYDLGKKDDYNYLDFLSFYLVDVLLKYKNLMLHTISNIFYDKFLNFV